jgi:hypothetical protein
MTVRPKDEDLVRAWVLKAEHDLLNIENNLAARDIPWDTVMRREIPQSSPSLSANRPSEDS